MRDFLRFVISSEDQARIVPDSITVEDVGFDQASDFNAPPPQSLKVCFRVKAPEDGGERQAPRINPLFPGAMHYIASLPESGNVTYPSPANVNLSGQNISGWPINGMLSVFVTDHNSVLEGMRAQVSNDVLPIIPNRAWYYPVKLTKEFLFQTIAGPEGAGLTKRDVLDGTPAVISPSSPIEEWRKNAIAYFLQGRYEPHATLDAGNDANADDIATMDMPTVVMDSEGYVELFISMAYHRSDPHEGDQLDFAGMQPDNGAGNSWSPSPSLRALIPHYVQNARIPARAVYQSFLTAAGTGGGSTGVMVNCTGAEVLCQEIQHAEYYQIVRFTRSWTPGLARILWTPD